MKKSEVIHVDILTRCPTCGGEGRYYRPHCVGCYTYFSEDQMDEWLAKSGATLPCGCGHHYLFDKEECDACCGVGTIHHAYSPAHAMKMLRELQE